MSTQDIVQLPHQHIGHLEGEDLKAAIERNFKEIAHMLYILQMYEKTTGKPINDKVDGVLDENGNVLTSKLSEKMVGLANELQLADDAVTTAKLAVAAVVAEKIKDGEVITDKLAANAVTAVKINAGAVIAEKIAAGAVTAEKLSVEELSAITAYLGTIIGGNIYGTMVRSGSPGATTYISLNPAGILESYYQGKQNIGMWAGQNWGNIIFYEDGQDTGQLYAANEYDPVLGGTRRKFVVWSRGNGSLRLTGPGIHLQSDEVMLSQGSSSRIVVGGKIWDSLLPFFDNSGYVGMQGQKWNTVRAQFIDQGDSCFEERECAICEQSFEAGDSIVLLARHIHEEHGTMCIPIHERCKNTPKTLTIEVPETETIYRLKENGEVEGQQVSKFAEVQEEIRKAKEGYSLDEKTGQFRKEVVIVKVAREGYFAKKTKRGLKFHKEDSGEEVQLDSILEDVKIFDERPATKDEAVEVATIKKRVPVMKKITVKIGGKETEPIGPALEKS